MRLSCAGSWGGLPREPPLCSSGGQGGAGSRSWQSSQCLAASTSCNPGDAACWRGGLSPHNRRVAHGPMMGVQDSASHPLQSGSGRGVQRESRTGGGAGARGGKVGQPGCCWGHGVGAWGTQHLIETKCRRGGCVFPAKEERPWGGREPCSRPRDRERAQPAQAG